MSIRKALPPILGRTILVSLVALAHAQTSEQAARLLASSTVRSELRSKLNFKPDQFLSVQRDEELGTL